MQQREFPLTHGLSGESERRVNILRLQVGKRPKNCFLRHSFRNHADNGRHRNSQATNTRHTIHLLWIDGNSVHGCNTGEGTEESLSTSSSIPPRVS